jgi:hypothetical protein
MIPYEHRQPGTVMRIGVGAVLTLIIGTQLVVGDAPRPVWVLTAGLVVLLVLYNSLTVTVDRERVVAAFGPGLIRRTIPVDEILGASIGRCAWYNGWGTRLTATGWMYRVSGMSTVDLTLVAGRFRIGTDDPQGLLDAVQAAMGQRKAPGVSR